MKDSWFNKGNRPLGSFPTQVIRGIPSPAQLPDGSRVPPSGRQELEQEFGVKHLPSDFKKQNGYLRSLQLSEEYGASRIVVGSLMMG